MEIQIGNNNSLNISIGSNTAEPYTGSYNVRPRKVEQTLSTNQKYMTSNVVVQKIPYYEVSNISGKTVIIGDE